MKQQMSVVKSSLGALNDSLTDVAYNEGLMKEEMSKVSNYVRSLQANIDVKLNLISVRTEVEGHISRASSAMNAAQRKLDLLIDSVLNAKKGILQPQIVSPSALVNALTEGASAFPKDTTLPIPLSKDSAYQLLRLCTLQVYIKQSVLVYVISIPLVNKGDFDIYKPIPIPVPSGQKKFVYIDTGRSLLWVDQARQYYFLSDKASVERCTIVNTLSRVCEQVQPLLLSHLHDNFLVDMMQSRSSIPPTCERKVVELSHPVWTQLKNNEWIYVVPVSEMITILCSEKPPIDVTVSGIGKLSLQEGCKGFGRSAHFRNRPVLNVNSQGYESDFLSMVDLRYDCCEDLKVKDNLSAIQLNASFRHIVTHLDDLKLASHKVSEIEDLIRKNEGNRLHAASHTSHSLLVYACLIVLGLWLTFKLYACVRRKAKCFKNLAEATGAGNVVNIKIHTSNESLALAPEEVPLTNLHFTPPEATPRGSRRVKGPRSCF
jgi:hypothetical protein